MSDKLFRTQPWTPAIQKTAEDLTMRIHAQAPELEVLFMGAAALGLPGKNDIDLDMLCDQAELKSYTEALQPILGTPKDVDDTLVIWEFTLNGFVIDAILSDPKTSHVPLQRKRFEILKASPQLQKEYIQLKEDCDGLPYAEYEKRKQTFFEERVVS